MDDQTGLTLPAPLSLPNDVAEHLGYYEEQVEDMAALSDAARQRARLALHEIHQRELWRSGYQSFVDYCRDRWGLGKSRAYELVAWATEELLALDKVAGQSQSGIPDFSGSDPTPPVLSLAEAERRRAERKAPPRGTAEAVEATSTPTSPTKPAQTTPATVVPSARSVPVQPSLFDVPTEDLLGELRNRLSTADKQARKALAVQLRTLLAAADPPAKGSPRNPHPAPPRSAAKPPCRCSKGPTKSPTITGLCTACHGWFR